ncbi:phosphopantetheine-binding protein [Nocardiopsis alba]|uniref:phosphopantetheine-binding protein n=1 Tax=Nocardiopsis alba TaxID=53437 RepID=UPI0033ED6B34
MSKEDLRQEIRSLWQDTLGVEVDEETDFFEVGGHSFMAMRIIARIDEKYGTGIPLRLIFDLPRLGEFTGGVEKELDSLG